MTNLQNNIKNTTFDNYLLNAKLEIMSDISFAYRYEDSQIVVDFYQDEKGKNHLEEFCINHNGMWFPILANDYQLKQMWDKLNNTTLDFDTIVEEEPVADLYDYFGVKPSNFY